MKISDNMSRRMFSWQLRFFRAGSALLFIYAFYNRKYFVDSLASSAILFAASILSFRRRLNHLLEVYDCGENIVLKFDDDEVSVNFREIEKFEIRDGQDDLDWIAMYLLIDSKFGRLIQFYPDMVNISEGNLNVWLSQLNQRVKASR